MKASEPQNDILHSTQQINMFLAGQGSGKTFCAGMVSKTFIDHFPNIRGLIAANTYSQLNRSTLFRMREFWKDCGMHEYKEHLGYGDYVIGKIPPKSFNTSTHNYDSYHNIISFRNGHVIYTGSLDNFMSLDGMEVAYALCDETKDTKKEAIIEVVLGRVRQTGIWISDQGKKTPYKEFGVRPFNPLYIFTSPAKVQWLNEWFELDEHEAEILAKIFKKDDYFKLEKNGRMVTISSAYLNRDNLPDGWIERQMQNMPSHLQDMLIYGSPFSKTGGEFYKCFDRTRHVQHCEYDKKLPLHLTFDFNVAPYITLCIWQVTGTHAKQIDEICLTSPNNNTKKLCQEFKRIYQGHNAGMFIYGDATGKNRSSLVEEGHDHFKIIEDELYEYRAISRVPAANPSVVMRGNFVNTIFESEFADIKITISPDCSHTIADYTYLKEKPDGTKLKEKEKDELTGEKFEKYGHTSDANDYFLCDCFSGQYQDYQNPPMDTDLRNFGGVSSQRKGY